MSGMDLLPLGVGDAFSAEHYSLCLALRAAGRWLLVDCPHPIRKMMRDASRASGAELDVDGVEGVALTHLHSDHASGVEGLGFFSHFVLGRRARIAAHPLVAERLWAGHLAAGMERMDVDGREERMRFEDWFELLPLDEGSAVELGPFRVECRRTWHHVPTTALRISAGGRRLGFSADTRFDRELVEWLAESDLVVHEAGFKIHTPIEKLADLEPAIRAKMRLAHVPDGLDVSGAGIERLEEGRLYEV